jgi:hypothetical protein
VDPHTDAVVSQDTALFYNATTGDASVGELDSGKFFSTNYYKFSIGWTRLAAGCDTVFLLNTKTRSFAVGLLQGGAFVQKQSLTLNAATHIAASCNSLLTYNSNTGAGSTYTFGGGRVNLSSRRDYSFASGWTHITATRNSVLFYDAGTGEGAWGSLTAGTYVERGFASTFSKGFTAIGGTYDTLVFYKYGSSVVGFSQLLNGQYKFVGSVSGFSNHWNVVTGGK